MNKNKRVLSIALAVLIMLSVAAVIVIADGETCNVVIKYVYADGKQAAPSWTAKVAKGSRIDQTVTSPAVVGYAPDKTTVSLNVSNIQEDITETVTYRPAEVVFTVKHYQQNVDNDKYTLFETESKNGFTESEVGNTLAKTYEGFTALLYDTTTKIAADGSTVVEIYYDRNYYMLSLNLDGGYGAEPVYARYGAKVEISDPTKPGYTFDGWEPTLPATVPAENMTYTAKWKADQSAKVTVVFWGENADDEQYSYYKSFETTATPGETFTLPADGTVICGKTEHTHSAACGYTCGITEHKNHTTDCYAGVGKEASVQGLISGSKTEGSIGEHTILSNRKYIYINGTWYNYEGTASVGSTAPTTCGKQLHTHSASCGYACGMTEHKHTDACRYSSGMDSNLWKFVRSDEVTVAADGSTIVNVYYDRVEFTLHFRKANNNSDNYGTITAKWGANIREQFNAKSTAAGTSNWSEKEGAGEPWTSYLDIMPEKDMTFYAYTSGSGTSTAYYYVEGLDGKDELYYKNVSTGTGYTVTKEEFIKIDGFTFNASRSAKVGDHFDNAKFYYTRNSYNLKFLNYGVELTNEKKSVQYEAALNGYNFTPDYPANLEANAYEFAGWYTTEKCIDGTEMKWDTAKMPASDVLLYAKWAPKTHTVKTYLTEDAMSGDPIGTWEVAHRLTIDKPVEPTNGNYTFVGWFYKENGVEKAFDFSMAVTKDLDLYAKWSSNTLVEYTIKYELEDGTVIAAETTGSALAGTTKTFEAKTGADLYESYQSGYFPTTASHSIDMQVEGGNKYTFVYVAKEKVGYTVRYLEKDTNKELRPEKSDETQDNIITEQFEVISGYAPDAYSKRLVLSANEAENVITFWYTKDDEHAPVQVIHWIQNIEGDGYSEHQSTTDVNGVIGQEYSATPLTIEGFTFKEGKVGDTATALVDGKLTGIVAENGLVLNLYYDRIEYPYEFRFVDEDGNTIADTVSGKARYEAQVTCTANEKIDNGYKLKSDETNPKAIVIEIEDPETIAKKNVKTFVYETYFTVVHVQGNNSIPEEVTIIPSIKTNGYSLTDAVTEGYLYGGAFSDEACETVQTFEPGESAISFKPEKGKTYYIWEVSQNYLKPKNYSVWRHIPEREGKIGVINEYLMTTIDREKYQLVGFDISYDESVIQSGNVYEVVNAMKGENLYQQLYVKGGNLNVSNNIVSERDRGYIGIYKLNPEQFAKFSGENVSFTFIPYWVTLDGIKVTGTEKRTCTFNGYGNADSDKITVNNTEVGSSKELFSTVSAETVAVEAEYYMDASSMTDKVDETPDVPVTPDVPETPVVPEVPEAPEMTLTGEAMFLRAQFTYDMMTNTAKFISAIDVNACTEYGFVINGETIKCEEAAETVDGYSAAYLFGDSVNGAMLMSCNMLLDGLVDGMTLNVTPYYVALDGTVVYGETRTLVYRQWMGLEG